MLKNIFVVFLLIFIIFAIIYSQLVCSAFHSLQGDDYIVMFNYYKGFLKEYFINAYHGRFLTNTIAVLLNVILPLKLNIHPVEWMKTFGSFFKSTFIFLIFFQLSSSIFVYSQKGFSKTTKNIYLEKYDGSPLTNEEIEKPNFNVLLNKYRN